MKAIRSMHSRRSHRVSGSKVIVVQGKAAAVHAHALCHSGDRALSTCAAGRQRPINARRCYMELWIGSLATKPR